MIEQRKALDQLELDEMGRNAQKACLDLTEFAAATVLALYAPAHNEIGTSVLVAEALGASKVVLFPAVVPGGLEFRRITDVSLLVPGRFGIPEPPSECERYNPADVDLFIIPGVAFDQACRRVGYGKGYYDRTLHQLEGRGRLAGLCYDFQLVEEIPAAPHDVQMDMVITDRRVVRRSGQFT